MSAPEIDLGSLDELVDGGDPLDCPACLDAGDVCSFHAGWAAGWDACASFVARVVEDDRDGELSHGGRAEEVAR